MSEEEAIDILKNSIANFVIGEYCEECADWLICDTKNEDCYFQQAIDIVINLIQKQQNEIEQYKQALKEDVDKFVKMKNSNDRLINEINRLNDIRSENQGV